MHKWLDIRKACSRVPDSCILLAGRQPSGSPHMCSSFVNRPHKSSAIFESLILVLQYLLFFRRIHRTIEKKLGRPVLPLAAWDSFLCFASCVVSVTAKIPPDLMASNTLLGKLFF